jgi:hypothetical protein
MSLYIANVPAQIPTKHLPVQFRDLTTLVRRGYFSFISFWGKVIPLGTSATIWIIVPTQMMDDDDDVCVWRNQWNAWQGKPKY